MTVVSGLSYKQKWPKALGKTITWKRIFFFEYQHGIESHRRTGRFLPGGAVNHLPKKSLQVAQIFTKQSNRNEGRCNNIGRTGIWKWLDTVFQGQYLPKFEHKLRRHKQTFGKIATTVVLDKDENLLWSGLQWYRSCRSNEMKPLSIMLAAIFLRGNCSSKIDHRSFFLQKSPRCSWS